MRFLRAIGHDLVEKRLWPVAAVLLLALVAVPFLLGRGGGEDATTTAPTAVAAAPGAASAAAAAAEVTVAGDEPADRDRPGDLRDPFRPKGGAKAKSDAPDVTTKAADGAGSGSSASASAGASGGSSSSTPAPSASSGSTTATTPSPSTTPTTATTPAGAVKASTTTPVAPVTLKTMRVDLRFGDAEALTTPKVRQDVARLTTMPTAKDAKDTSIVFLGVLRDRRTAAFLLPEGATAQGEGRCRPSVKECSTIELRAGDTQYVDVPPADGADGVARQFELTVARVRDTRAKTAAAAVEAHKRRSAAGAALVREALADGDAALEQYAFRYDQGVLVRRAAKAAAKAK